MEHFVFIPKSPYWWHFLLRRDRTLGFGVQVETKKAFVEEGTIKQLSNDELVESLEIHSAILSGDFEHPSIEQSIYKSERNANGQTFNEWDLWYESIRSFYRFDHTGVEKLNLWQQSAGVQQIIMFGN